MKRRELHPISDILSSSLLSVMTPEGREKYYEHRISIVWSELLGPTITSYTSDFSFSRGTIMVRILSPALRQDLFMQRVSLIEKLNEKIGEKKVVAIVLR